MPATDGDDPLTEHFAELVSALRVMRVQVQRLARVHESIESFNSAFGNFQNAMNLHASCLQYPKPAPAKKVSVQFSGIPAPQVSGTSIVRRLSRESADSNGGGNVRATTPMGGSSSSNANRNASNGSSATNKGSKKQQKKPLSMGSASSIYQQQQLLQQPKNKLPSKLGQVSQKKRRAPPATSAKRPASPAWKWDKHIRDQIPRKYQTREELQKLENILLYIKNRRSGITIADLVKHSGLAVIKSKEILQTLMKLELIHRDHEKSGFVYTFGSVQ